MLTKRENLMETIRGGHPDRFVNQYEAIPLVMDPLFANIGGPLAPGKEVVNGWGVTIRWPENVPGPFPVHDEEHKVLKDITKWREQVKAPKLDYPPEAWEGAQKEAAKIDRKDQFVSAWVAPGMFEKLHYLMGMEDALINFYEEPEAMHELIDFLTDWEVEYAKQLCDNLHPDAIFHHDDWGSQKSSFLSPEMFEEYFVPAYEKIYSYYKNHGCELVVHHSDSYAANLVPSMLKMGIDIWQGCMSTNNIPELIEKYGGKLTFMGGIDNGRVDVPDWTPEKLAEETEKVCRECGTRFFIPNTTMGGPMSTFPGVYETVSKEIDRMSKEMF